MLEEQKEDFDPDAILEMDEDDENPDDMQSQMELQQFMKAEDIVVAPESSDISEIDKLTGVPHRNDTLLFGIPMLAPYMTVQNFKYKVKVVPGTNKRGRVSKTIRDLFLKTGKDQKIETQFIKQVND